MDFRQNYFELFGLVVEFGIDIQALTSRYQELQKALHPDKYANASDQERRLSLQQTAQINTAYKTLKDPLSRASYLLELQGQSQNLETTTINDLAFLEEQMELRETLGDIRHSGDAQNALPGFVAQLKAKEKDYIDALASAFSNLEALDVPQAKNLVQRMQFVRRLQEEAELLEEELF